MGIVTYPYGAKASISAHLKVSEIQCKCGKNHPTKFSSELVQLLEKLFNTMHCTKFIVSSGYRCSYWDRHVGGYGSGPHCDGLAIDCCWYGKDGKVINTKIISCIAQDLGFRGIANITSDYKWIHLDMKPRTYYGDESKGTYNTVTSDFRKYYGISESQITAVTGTTKVVKPVTSTPASKVKYKWSNKYNPQIKELQQILVSKGANISVDGIAGPKTLTECKKYTIEKNDRGTLTAWVQKRLNTKGYKPGIADGIAGINTMNAIKQFQKDNGLGTGYLGGDDWYYLIK